MQILAIPNSPYGDARDREFKTVPAAIRFITRSYYEKGGVARHVEVYEMTAPIDRIDFVGQDKVVLTKGNIPGWEVGQELSVEEACAITKKLHRS